MSRTSSKNLKFALKRTMDEIANLATRRVTYLVTAPNPPPSRFSISATDMNVFNDKLIIKRTNFGTKIGSIYSLPNLSKAKKSLHKTNCMKRIELGFRIIIIPAVPFKSVEKVVKKVNFFLRAVKNDMLSIVKRPQILTVVFRIF